MSISEDAQNTVVNADGACPADCLLDTSHGTKSYQYNIATGAYTISFQGNRHFLGVDPTTGIQTEQFTQSQGSASGVWPVTISGAGLVAVIRGTPNTATIVMTPSVITSTESPYPIGAQLEPITIECQDTSGNTVPNCKIDLDYDVIEGSGGHVHNTDRPTGTFASSECSEPFVQHISCDTGTGGVAVLTYAAPEASGITETANGTVSANGQSSSFSFTINVLYDGLELASGSGLIIDTASRNHGNNNGWASHATNEALSYMASLFSDTLRAQGASPSAIPVIEIDAISLPLGGLFDYEANLIGHNWLPPHISHRFGNNADVCIKVGSDCSNGLTKKQRKVLASALKYAGFRRLVEASHWHLIGPY